MPEFDCCNKKNQCWWRVIERVTWTVTDTKMAQRSRQVVCCAVPCICNSFPRREKSQIAFCLLAEEKRCVSPAPIKKDERKSWYNICGLKTEKNIPAEEEWLLSLREFRSWRTRQDFETARPQRPMGQGVTDWPWKRGSEVSAAFSWVHKTEAYMK